MSDRDAPAAVMPALVAGIYVFAAVRAYPVEGKREFKLANG